MAQADYDHLLHIKSHADLTLYELIPTVVWIFDLDKHGWWWGNAAALRFWGLDTLDQLVNKDLSGDTQGARDRTRQTFDLAARDGLTVDPWTTYPQGKPKTVYMMHRAVLVGPDKHRAIIAYINEEVDLGQTPENLLLVEAMRYTTVLVTSFTLEGAPVVENPAATEAYKSIDPRKLPRGASVFEARFVVPGEGRRCLTRALDTQGGRWTHDMRTDGGIRRHTLDIRRTRHQLTGEPLLLVVEYDVTDLHEALDAAEQAQEKLRQQAHYDALTGLPSLHLLQERATALLAQAQRHGQRLAVMFIDLDGFKGVNDTHGHDAGDAVLKVVADRFSACLRSSDHVARVGGDEFVVLVSDITAAVSAETVAEKLIACLSEPIPLPGVATPVTVGASVGIAYYPDQGRDMHGLLKAADQSMYCVKKAGKGDYRVA